MSAKDVSETDLTKLLQAYDREKVRALLVELADETAKAQGGERDAAMDGLLKDLPHPQSDLYHAKVSAMLKGRGLVDDRLLRVFTAEQRPPVVAPPPANVDAPVDSRATFATPSPRKTLAGRHLGVGAVVVGIAATALLSAAKTPEPAPVPIVHREPGPPMLVKVIVEVFRHEFCEQWTPIAPQLCGEVEMPRPSDTRPVVARNPSAPSAPSAVVDPPVVTKKPAPSSPKPRLVKTSSPTNQPKPASSDYPDLRFDKNR